MSAKTQRQNLNPGKHESEKTELENYLPIMLYP